MMNQQPQQTYYQRLEGDIPQISFDVSSGEAVNFISFDRASQEFHLHDEVNDLLLDYQGKIAFVFNLGEKKVGKSFLLNKVLDLEPGNCFDQNTKGLKIWSTACVKDSEDLSIFFVDCESGGGDKQLELFVWSLAFLVGSVVMLHSFGPMDKNTWNHLETIDHLKRKIIFSDDEMENEYSLSHVAPRLIWLMRDYEITLKDVNGRLMTADNYLDMELRDNNEGETINDRKLTMINVFKERLGFAMPSPDDQPVNFNQGTEDLNEEFLYHLEHLKERIYSKTGPKLFEGVAFDSRMFLNAVNCLIEVFNSDKPMYFNEMVEIVFQEEVDMLLSDGKEFYNDLFLKAFPDFEEMKPVPAEVLLQEMKLIRQNTFENFTLPPQIKMKMSEEFTECFEGLQRYIENSERIFLGKNEEKAVQSDEILADELMKSFENEVSNHPPEGPKKQVEVFSHLIESVCVEFTNQAISEQKASILARLVSEMNMWAFERILQRQKTLSPNDMEQENEFKEKNATIDQKLEEIKKNNDRFGDDISKKREEVKLAHDSITETFKEKQELLGKLDMNKKKLSDITEAVKKQEEEIEAKKAELEALKKKKKKRWFCF
jgi:hypothetical protein